MSAHVPALFLEADPLIAEAKWRARRRRLRLAGAVLVLGIAAAGAVLGLRSQGPGRLPAGPSNAFQHGAARGHGDHRLGAEAALQREVAELRAREAALEARLRREERARQRASS